MRLGEFVNTHIEPILVEWEAFARSIWPAGTDPDPVELRNSAAEILHAIVADMDTFQSPDAQARKATGRAQGGHESDRLDHASQVHGTGRVGSGLSLPAVVAEYRALRASILRLWRESLPAPDASDLADLTRFNEAIDQSLALAVESYTRRLDTARKMFLGILGHDLRSPLTAIIYTASEALDSLPDTRELPRQLQQIADSADAISHLVTDLIDLTSSTLGVRLPLTPASADLRALCEEVAREMRAAWPGRSIRLQHSGNLTGTWDAHRLRQLIANLLSNALQHGAPDTPVDLALDGTAADTVVLTVHNTGHPIPAEALQTIFDPLVRCPPSEPQRRVRGSIGLGLYIVREIAATHGGTAQLTSSASAGTTATIRLPRHA